MTSSQWMESLSIPKFHHIVSTMIEKPKSLHAIQASRASAFVGLLMSIPHAVGWTLTTCKVTVVKN